MHWLFQSNRKKAHLYLTTSKDGAVLLDVEQDRLIKLNNVALEMLRLVIAGNSESEIIEEIRERCGADRLRVATDLENLIRRVRELGLNPRDMAPAESAPPTAGHAVEQPVLYRTTRDTMARRAQPTRVMVASALLGLFLFDAVMALLSMRALCALVKRWPVRRSRSKEQANVIGRVASAVERACVWYPKKALCLQRSAVMTCVLRSYAVTAQMLVGVRSMPLLAHAWVEVDGAVVNDFPRVKTFYQAFTAY